MQIGNINIGGVKKTEDKTTVKNNWFNRAVAPDKFEKSSSISDVKNTPERTKISVTDATYNVSVMKRADGTKRFSDKDVEMFRKLAEKEIVHYDMVAKLADTTEFNMAAIGNVGKRIKSTGDEEWKLIDNINRCAKELPVDKKATSFQVSPFEPDSEMSLSYNNKGCLEKMHFDYTKEQPEVIGKSKSFLLNYDVSSGKLEYKTTSEDYRNNLKSSKIEYLTSDGYPDGIKSETIKRYNKNGKLLRTDIMTESEISGVHNIKYEFPDGKSRDVVKATVDPKTGIKTIKKDMRSTDGTKTEFLYEDDPKGNRIIDYKITGTDGKLIMKNSQTFEVVDDNHFISSKNGHKYEIETDEKGLKVKDVSHSGKEVSIEFDKKIKGNKDEIVSLLKKVPGEELFEVVDCCKKINGRNHNELMSSAYNMLTKNINMADNLFVFLHELGHAKDGEHRTVKDVLITGKNKIFEENPNIQKTYIKERENFNKAYPHAQREHIDYFIQKDGHYGGVFGGLQEVIAESNAITNTYTNGDVKCLSTRSQYLQQHFPKTIAAIQEAMYYKNDIEALQYYGT